MGKIFKMKVLVTGGAGFIGSHTVLELLESGHGVEVVDNLSNGNIKALERVKKISGKNLVFHEVDIRDRAGLSEVFAKSGFGAVVHFAGLKAVGESASIPLAYYQNNICGSLTLFETMSEFGVKKLVFSSSATVYGVPESVPISESAPLCAVSPYGRTKLFLEEIIRDLYCSDPTWGITVLRYFNPIGAHSSGLIGEDPCGVPNNLMPYISQVAIGKLPRLNIFGGDYPTIDGTGVRDYIHVVDLATGHIKALENMLEGQGLNVYNLGTGNGISVLELVTAFERVSGRKVPYEIVERRAGDVAECYADPSRAWEALKWKAARGVDDMCRDSWLWQSKNPDGYR